MGACVAAAERRPRLRNGARAIEGDGRGDVPAARARDDCRGAARARRQSAHRARAPLRGQGSAGGRSRARGRRAGDRAVAGPLGAILDLPQAAAGGRSRVAGCEAQDPPARDVRRQAARRWRMGSPAAPCRARCGTSCTRITGSPKCSSAPSPRSPTTCFPTPSASRAIRRTATRCCWGSPIPCAMSVRQIELTDRWLAMWARKVFPVRAAARNRRPGHSHRSRRRRGRDARAERARQSGGVDALRLSRQARDQRPRAIEAPAIRRQPGGIAARARLQHRAMHDAPGASRFALVPDPPAPARARRRRRSSFAPAAFRPPTSA